MENQDYAKVARAIESLDNEGLDSLQEAIRATRASRRMEVADIHPGMSNQQRDQARADIASALREMGR